MRENSRHSNAGAMPMSLPKPWAAASVSQGAPRASRPAQDEREEGKADLTPCAAVEPPKRHPNVR